MKHFSQQTHHRPGRVNWWDLLIHATWRGLEYLGEWIKVTYGALLGGLILTGVGWFRNHHGLLIAGLCVAVTSGVLIGIVIGIKIEHKRHREQPSLQVKQEDIPQQQQTPQTSPKSARLTEEEERKYDSQGRTSSVVRRRILEVTFIFLFVAGMSYLGYGPYSGFNASRRVSKKASTSAGESPDASGRLPTYSPTVWVDTDSGKYYCPGSDKYKNTQEGTLMRQSEADEKSYKPAPNGYCIAPEDHDVGNPKPEWK